MDDVAMARASGAQIAFAADTMIVTRPRSPPTQSTSTGTTGCREPGCRISPPKGQVTQRPCVIWADLHTLRLLVILSSDSAVKGVSYCNFQNAHAVSAEGVSTASALPAWVAWPRGSASHIARGG